MCDSCSGSGFPLASQWKATRLLRMGLAQKPPRLSEAEYLRSERQAEFKSEYFEGDVFAIAGGTRAHSLISTNLLRELSRLLKRTNCVSYNADLRVKVETTGLLTYPDVCSSAKSNRALSSSVGRPTASGF